MKKLITLLFVFSVFATNAQRTLFTSQNKYVAPVAYANIITTDLLLYLDASNITSYPGSGNTWYDLSTNVNPFSNKEKSVENLPKNYRSYSEVIDFNNQFFQFLSEEFTNEAYQKLYKETAGQETNEKTGGFVSVTFLDDTIEINEEIAEDESITEKDKQYLCQFNQLFFLFVF